jgi:hypothetical protein
MKFLASLISIYFLLLGAVPAVQVVRMQLIPECGSSCTKEQKPTKDTEGCDKRECSVSSCCYKNIFLEVPTKFTLHYFQDIEVNHNFWFNEIITSQNIFDIWHPPKAF